MKKIKYLLFVNVISILLLVTVSFAWIVEINSQEGRIFAMNFGQMYIAPTEIGVELLVVNKDGTTTNKTQFIENIDIDVVYNNLADEILINTQDKFINKQNEEKETEEK